MRSARLCVAPPATAITFVVPGGTTVWLSELSPQQNTVRSLRSAIPWPPPAATAITPECGGGAAILPQVRIVPLLRKAML